MDRSTFAGSHHDRLYAVAAAILILNLFDGLLTMLAVGSGAATEANPLMAAPLALGTVWFMLAKTSLVSLGVLLLWRRRGHRLAERAMVALGATYGFILLYHLAALPTWLA